MIKTRINNEYKDIIKIFGGGTLQKEITKVWSREANKYVYESSVEYTGTLPITITADGNALLDYCIYGNTVQDGTPTPENPVIPSGCGVRTENLYSSTLEQGTTAAGVLVPSNTRIRSGLIYLGTGQFTFSCVNDYDYQIAVDYHLSDGIYSRGTSWLTTKTFELISQAPIIRLKIRHSDDSSILPTDVSNIMLNLGSSPLPYEPYGYKLPLTINGVEYPIYLGEAETTRRIKKMVLTGEESWIVTVLANGYGLALSKKNGLTLCTHYKPSNNVSVDKSIYVSSTNMIIIFDSDYTTLDAFKSYLASQYAAGTPVTVWYVLAEPETGIVNEPLMKIGDYADTLSMEQADVSIPTIAGATVIDYDGTPKPSEMYIKYRR